MATPRKQRKLDEKVTTQKQDRDTVCDVCSTKGRQLEVHGYCTDCEKYLCVRCFRSHRKAKVRKSHVLVGKEHLPQQKLETSYKATESVKEVCTSKYGMVNRRRSRGCHRNPETNTSSSKVGPRNVFSHKADCTPSERTMHPVNLRASHVTTINVRSDTDTRVCFVTGCAVLPGEKIILADFHNDKLKLISMTSNQILSAIQVCNEPWIERGSQGHNGPWDVTLINNTDVAVTAPNRAEIVVVKIQDTMMKVIRSIPVKGKCRGIAFRYNIFIVTFDIPSKLETISIEGEVLTTVDLEVTTGFQRPLFMKPSLDIQNIYVSDWLMNCIAIVTIEGIVKAKYTAKSSQFANTCNMCFGPGGYVYLCNFRNNKVHVLTPDLEKQVVELSYGVTEPMSVAWCEQTKQLYIGMCGDTMKVLKFT